MRRGTHGLSALVVAGLLTLAACGGDPKVEPATGDDSAPRVAQSSSSESASSAVPTEADSDLPSDDDVHSYFDALSTVNVEALEEAAELAEKGSAAEAYAGYKLAYANASLDGGKYAEGNPVEETEGGGYRSCDDPADDSTCIEFAHIEGRGGKVVAFTANDQPIRDRIVVGTGEPVQAGSLASVTLLYAYQSIVTPNLYVIVNVKSGSSPVTVATDDAVFRGADGRQLEVDSEYSLGPTDLGADSSATMVLAFPQATLGGSATFSVLSDDLVTDEPVVIATK